MVGSIKLTHQKYFEQKLLSQLLNGLLVFY
jgi:hypothetical protein